MNCFDTGFPYSYVKLTRSSVMREIKVGQRKGFQRSQVEQRNLHRYCWWEIRLKRKKGMTSHMQCLAISTGGGTFADSTDEGDCLYFPDRWSILSCI